MDALKVKIAGEIALSSSSGATMRKWREIFGVTQSRLAKELSISVSTISDYEGDRRKSPGMVVVSRFVDALFGIDEARGGELVKRLRENQPDQKFFDVYDFSRAVNGAGFAEAIQGEVLCGKKKLSALNVFGCTVIDSLKMILELPYESFVKIYSNTSQRALLFTNVSTGRSPLVAVRVGPIKPALVVLHGLDAKSTDKLAVKIAEAEGIPLVVTRLRLEKAAEAFKSFEV